MVGVLDQLRGRIVPKPDPLSPASSGGTTSPAKQAPGMQVNPAAPKLAPATVPTPAAAVSAPQPMAALNPVPTGDPGSRLVQGPSARLPGIINRKGALGRLAESRGRAVAHRRGLRNSSLAAEASHKALLDYAVPLAEGDTQTELQNQERLAQDARHAVDASIARYGIDSANSRHEATLELQRYGIDEETARHAVDAAFREKSLTANIGLEREKITATRENLQTQIEANRAEQERAITAGDRRQAAELAANAANLEKELSASMTRLQTEITANREAQERAIAANDRQEAARLAQLGRELAAQNQRHADTLSETKAGREQNAVLQNRQSLVSATTQAMATYASQVNTINLREWRDPAAYQQALQNARLSLDSQMRLLEDVHDTDLDWTYWSPDQEESTPPQPGEGEGYWEPTGKGTRRWVQGTRS